MVIRRLVKRATSSINSNYRVSAQEKSDDYSQFSKSRLINNGFLTNGEIPEALRYDHPYKLTTLSNGVRVATEYFPNEIATVGVMIEAGSRNETMENTGIAHFLEHMHFKGTSKRTRVQLESEIENMGGNLNAYTSRETTLYQMQVFKNDVGRAMEIISDMLLTSKYDRNNIEVEREVILREAQEVDGDMRETILENVHYTAFRNHIMGQPILGHKSSILKISRDQLKKFIYTHYVGPRIVVLGAGQISHDQLVDIAEKNFGTVAKKTEFNFDGEDAPEFIGSSINVRNDLDSMAHLGVFYEAPSWKHEDYWAFLLLQRIMEHDPSNPIKTSHPYKHYNYLNRWFGEMNDINKQECLYIPYRDTGLFGHYATGEYINSLIKPTVQKNIDFIEELSEEEIQRAKNKVYNELLQIETGSDMIQTLGCQLIYMNRRIPKSEIGARVSWVDKEYLQHVYAKWFGDREIALALYGPMETIHKMNEI